MEQRKENRWEAAEVEGRSPVPIWGVRDATLPLGFGMLVKCKDIHCLRRKTGHRARENSADEKTNVDQ